MSLECCKPIKLYRNYKTNKYQINYDKNNCNGKMILVDCGRCPACNEKYKMQLGMRGKHELINIPGSMFLTLTVNEENIEKVFGENRELNHREFQLFIKRFRRFLDRNSPETKIKYLMCGEYGSTGKRPHYHVIIFGYEFEDMKIWKKQGKTQLWRSKTLEKLWKFGFSSIGMANYDSIKYLGKYVTKARLEESPDIINEETGEIRKKKKPYIVYPRGFGLKYMIKHRKQIFGNGFLLTPNGYKMAIPRYYKKKFKELFFEEYEIYKKNVEKMLEDKQKEIIKEFGGMESYYEYRCEQGKIRSTSILNRNKMFDEKGGGN